MGFELYHRNAGRTLGVDPEPVVSIHKNGNMAFSAGAQRLLGVRERGEIALLFDAATGQVGIRQWRKADGPGAKLTLANQSPKRSPNAALSVSGVGFFKQYQVDVLQVQGIRSLCADDRTGLAIIQLPAGSWKRVLTALPLRTQTSGPQGGRP